MHVAEAAQEAVEREVAAVDLGPRAVGARHPRPRGRRQAVPAALEQLRERPAAVRDDRVRARRGHHPFAAQAA